MAFARDFTPAFAPSALRAARSLAALTQSDVARLLEVTPQFVQQLESGVRVPSPDLVGALSGLLGVEPRFFVTPVPEAVTEANAFFRSLAGTPKRERDRVRVRLDLLYSLIARLRAELDFPTPELPKAHAGSPGVIADAARATRVALGLDPEGPIPNVVRALERSGLFVADLDGAHRSIDAFSVQADPPVIVRCVGKESSSRERFDVAHEVGHYVLHEVSGQFSTERESEANEFASDFLFPERAFREEFPRTRIGLWARLFSLKSRWGMSVSAIVSRASKLGVLDAAEARRLWVRISRAGWRRRPEPDEPPRERAELVAIAFREIHRARGATPSDIAADLGWSAKTLRRVLGEQVFAAVEPLNGGVVLRREAWGGLRPRVGGTEPSS